MKPILLLSAMLCSLQAAAQPGTIPTSTDLAGAITYNAGNVIVSTDGTQVTIVQQKVDSRDNGPFAFMVDAAGKATLLPKAVGITPEQTHEDGPGGYMWLAQLPDGSILSTKYAKRKKSVSEYAKPLSDFYLTPPGGRRRAIWEGELTVEGGFKGLLTGDGQRYIWDGGSDAHRGVLHIPSGKVVPLKDFPFTQQPWVESGHYLIHYTEKDYRNKNTFLLYSLETGAQLAKKELDFAWNAAFQLLGDSLILFSPTDKGLIERFRMSDAGFTPAGTYTVPLASLPLPKGTYGGYHYRMLAGEKLLIVPSELLKYYAGDMPSPAMMLYNLRSGKPEMIWPKIVRGAGERSVPAPSLSSSSTVVIATGDGKPVPSYQSSMGPSGPGTQYKPGTLFRRNNINQSPAEFIIMSAYNSSINGYTVLKREYAGARNTFFKSDDNTAMYKVEKTTARAYDLSQMGQVSGTVEVCPVCSGSGVINKDVVHTRGGSWEQVSFNIEVYTPYHVIAAWKERAECPRCDHTGLLKK